MQRSPLFCAQGLVKFVPAVARMFCLALPGSFLNVFTQNKGDLCSFGASFQQTKYNTDTHTHVTNHLEQIDIFPNQFIPGMSIHYYESTPPKESIHLEELIPDTSNSFYIRNQFI